MNQYLPFKKVIFFGVVCCLLFITCAKEYSYEGGPTGNSTGTAAYSLVDSAGTCLGATINGNYFKGAALDSTNTLVITVNVTKTGTYSLSTTALDGFSFYSFGTFTATGLQTITLKGSGTPADKGSFVFSTPLAAKCTYTITLTDPQAVFTLTGAPASCQDFVINGDYHPGKALTSLNTVDVSVDVTTAGAYRIVTDTVDGISFLLEGTFTKTGTQKVSIVGSGTPVVARNLVFTPKGSSSLSQSQCSFPMTITDNSPLATYVIESNFSSPAISMPCVSTIAGNYAAGAALTTSNTVTIRITCTIVGNYTIATNTSDGIMFAHSGAFTTTGAQYVTLEGTGTPFASGSFLFTPTIVGPTPIGGAACNFNLAIN